MAGYEGDSPPTVAQDAPWNCVAFHARSPKARGTPNKDQPSRTDAQAGKGMYVMGSLDILPFPEDGLVNLQVAVVDMGNRGMQQVVVRSHWRTSDCRAHAVGAAAASCRPRTQKALDVTLDRESGNALGCMVTQWPETVEAHLRDALFKNLTEAETSSTVEARRSFQEFRDTLEALVLAQKTRVSEIGDHLERLFNEENSADEAAHKAEISADIKEHAALQYVRVLVQAASQRQTEAGPLGWTG
ncbi:unnamed protein product [Cladocopium goreaui]|uniref:Uncharacterized protein n=1 Tax=Cladocopium goreaui TaxID=2562237 RepID=A0A9P1GPE2_9DINO|nr:unnamed protein product [Cladocopium goreaui]